MNGVCMRNIAARLRTLAGSGFLWLSNLASNRTEESRSRKFILLFNSSVSIAVNLVSGSFIVGLYTVLNVGNAMLGMLTAAAHLCNIAQILSPLLLNRFTKKKPVIIGLRALYHFFLIVLIGLIPFIPAEDGFRVGILIVFTVIANIMGSLAGPGLSLLHIRAIPMDIRADFFSLLTLLNSVSAYLFILIGSNIVDTLRDRGSLLAGVTAVRCIALACAVVEIIATVNTREFPEPVVEKVKISIPYKDKKFMMCVAMTGMWSFFANMPGLYYTSYLINDISVPYSFLGACSTLSIPLMIIFTPIWNKIIRKRSWFRSAAAALLAYTAYYFMLSFVDATNYKILYPAAVILVFAAAPCMSIVIGNMPYLHLPESGRSGYLSFFAAFNSFVAMLGVLSGSLWIQLTTGFDISIFGRVLQTKQYILIFVGILALSLSGAFALLRNHE